MRFIIPLYTGNVKSDRELFTFIPHFLVQIVKLRDWKGKKRSRLWGVQIRDLSVLKRIFWRMAALKKLEMREHFFAFRLALRAKSPFLRCKAVLNEAFFVQAKG
ncbi:MAG: hypothetical protein ACOYJY_02830 [Acutalibacteraceae bacterium]